MSIEDADDFVQATELFEESNNKPKGILAALAEASQAERDERDKKKPTPGQPSQYALFGPGYAATTPTIPTLPPGIYDINVADGTPFVVPMPKPTGLLLELPEMRSDEVIRLVNQFWDSEKDYKEGNEFIIGGAAYKSGVMIYGPPGSGKSCTIKLVSNKLVERGGTVFHASCNPVYVMRFLSAFAKIEKDRKCIVILEDIDSLIRDMHGETGYLEMLDSAKSIENVIFIATTNYPDKLDPRIYNRPGRFSHVVKIGAPGPAAREAYLKAILKNHRDVPEIVSNSENFSIDHLSALVSAVYREKKNLKEEMKRLRTLFKVPTAEEARKLGL